MTEFDRKVEEASARFNRSVSKYRRDSGKGDGGTGDLSERRSGARCTHPLLESSAHGGGKTLRVRGIFGNSPQEVLKAIHSMHQTDSPHWRMRGRRALCSIR